MIKYLLLLILQYYWVFLSYSKFYNTPEFSPTNTRPLIMTFPTLCITIPLSNFEFSSDITILLIKSFLIISYYRHHNTTKYFWILPPILQYISLLKLKYSWISSSYQWYYNTPDHFSPDITIPLNILILPMILQPFLLLLLILQYPWSLFPYSW